MKYSQHSRGCLYTREERVSKRGCRASEEPSCASWPENEYQPGNWPQRKAALSQRQGYGLAVWSQGEWQWPGAAVCRWSPFWLRPYSNSPQVSVPGPVCPPAGTVAAPPPHQPGVPALPRQAGTRQVSGRSQALHDSTSHSQAAWVC